MHFNFGLVSFWKRLYNNGARKFEIIGVSTIGCCPSLRLKNKTECFSEANLMSMKYNEALQSMLKELKLINKDLSYSYFDTYAALQDLIQNPTSYGMIYDHIILCLFALRVMLVTLTFEHPL